MERELYQKIWDAIAGTLPENWESVIFYVEYIGKSYEMKYYVSTPEQKNISCFQLGTVGRMDLIRRFMQIDRAVSVVRAALDEEKRWTVLTLTVDKNGHFKAYYDYCDLSEDTLGYEQQWKKKYLTD